MNENIKKNIKRRMDEIATEALSPDLSGDIEANASAKYRIDGLKEALRIIEETEPDTTKD